MRPSPATKMRPLASIGDENRQTPSAISSELPPAYTVSPVSPSKPSNRWESCAPTIHTMAFDIPSVVVEMGEPIPIEWAHQAIEKLGGEVGCIRIARRS